MTPGARIRTAIELLDMIEHPPPGRDDVPADIVLNGYFRGRRFAGAKDRRAISDMVFAVLRNRAALDWHWGADSGGNRHRVLAHLALDGAFDVPALDRACDGAGYAAPPLSAAERGALAALANGARENPPPAVRGNFPAWLEDEARLSFGNGAAAEFAALSQAAPLDIRVNTLRAMRAGVLQSLAGRGLAVSATPHSPLGIRIEGRVNLLPLPEFREGRIEVQDEGSQLAALLVEAEPGMTVLDYCAGAGGKSLALAADMANKGAIVAHDASPKRLAPIAARTARAGATIVRTASPPELAAMPRAGFDRVLVDAPCSGSGAWRRHPEAKWRLTPERLATLHAAQRDCLDLAADFVRPGGRLIYVTCSMLQSENGKPVHDFLARNPAFRPMPLAPVWQRRIGALPPFAGTTLQLTPRRSGTDGFFVALMERPA